MKIAFDVDGVVLNSIDVILEYINKVMGKRLAQSDLVSWELEDLGIDFKTLWDAVDYMYSQPLIEPYDGAVEFLAGLFRHTREPLLFITGRREPATALRQLAALNWNSDPPEIIVTGGSRNKSRFLDQHSVDFMVEDDVEHVEEYLGAGIKVGLMVRPWNSRTSIPVTQRFRGWNDVERWFAGQERA